MINTYYLITENITISAANIV